MTGWLDSAGNLYGPDPAMYFSKCTILRIYIVVLVVFGSFKYIDTGSGICLSKALAPVCTAAVVVPCPPGFQETSPEAAEKFMAI